MKYQQNQTEGTNLLSKPRKYKNQLENTRISLKIQESA